LSIEEKGLGGASIAIIVIFCTAIVSVVVIVIVCCCCKGQKSIDNHEANQIAYDANIPG
jgi:heme/copper-type cytochrome/quinol oxidase subunit 2